MVYIQNWHEFQDAAEGVYDKSPHKTRYCVKWKASDGKLVLKITDDSTCIKFKTYSSIFLNRFEALNLSLMEKMQNRRPVAEQPVDDESLKVTASSAISGTAGVSSGGVKKKKPKKKK